RSVAATHHVFDHHRRRARAVAFAGFPRQWRGQQFAGIAQRNDRMKKNPMTAKGAERLRAEVERLKSVERPRIIAAIAEARAHGGLKKKAATHGARGQP